MQNTVTISIDRHDSLRESESNYKELREAVRQNKNALIEWTWMNGKERELVTVVSDEDIAAKLNSKEDQIKVAESAIDQLKREKEEYRRSAHKDSIEKERTSLWAEESVKEAEEKAINAERIKLGKMAIAFTAGILVSILINVFL